MRAKFYVGCKAWKPWEVFRAESDPIIDTHGKQYNAVIGPFRTLRGAKFMALYGKGNPHCTTVFDAEALAKQYV